MLLRTVDVSELLVCGKLLKIFNIISAHYERLFKDLQTQIHGEAVTGLLLIYPVHIIHVIEVRENIFCKIVCSMHTVLRFTHLCQSCIHFIHTL